MTLTTDQFFEHCNQYDGYCKECDEVTAIGDVEPDAEERLCEVCDNKSVYGMEQALILGFLEIDIE